MEHLKSIIYQQYIVDKQDLNMFLRINLLTKEMNHLLRLIIFSQVVNILSLCYLYFF